MGRHVLYLDEATKAAHVDDKHRRDQTDDDKAEYHEQKRQRRSEERNERRGIPGGFDAFDALTMVLFTAMPAEEVRNYLKECREMAAAVERKGLEEKANSWTEGVLSTPNGD